MSPSRENLPHLSLRVPRVPVAVASDRRRIAAANSSCISLLAHAAGVPAQIAAR